MKKKRTTRKSVNYEARQKVLKEKIETLSERYSDRMAEKLFRLREELKLYIIRDQFHIKHKSMDEALEYADIEIKRIEDGTDKEKAHDRRN